MRLVTRITRPHKYGGDVVLAVGTPLGGREARRMAHWALQAAKEEIREQALAYAACAPLRRASTARYQTQRDRATPQWANREAMSRFYEKAYILTQETGVPHEVDHIVPIQSRLVCGLHTQANLRVVTKAENLRKSNQEWPDMPEKTPYKTKTSYFGWNFY